MTVSIAVTDRIELREPRPSDAGALAEEADSKAVWLNLTHAFPHPYTYDDATAWITSCLAQEPPRELAITVDDRLVGVCGVHLGVGVGANTGSVGYWLGENHWGRGIMTASLTAFLRYAWDTFDLERPQAEVFSWNPASVRVLEKNGFIKEGTRRASIHKDGNLIDESFFALLRSESQ